MPARRVLLTAACSFVMFCSGSSPTEPQRPVFVIRTCETQTFRVMITNPGVAAEAEARIGKGEGRLITGTVVRGNGGFNAPWSWHLDPASVRFADAAIEICDGCPDYVERNLDEWIATVKYYCPWGTQVIAKE